MHMLPGTGLCKQSRKRRTTRAAPVVSAEVLDLGVEGYTDVITDDDATTAINKFDRRDDI